MSIENIERLAQRHANDRQHLEMAVLQLQAELTAAKRGRLPQIKRLADRARESHEGLTRAIDENRDLFVKPRSRLFHGIRLGLERGKGKLKFESKDELVKAIRKLFPDRFLMLVKVTEKPIVNALQALPAKDLKRLGCEIVGMGDQVIVRSTDSDIDKLVDALVNPKTPEDKDTEE